jgi:hypothetical protein
MLTQEDARRQVRFEARFAAWSAADAATRDQAPIRDPPTAFEDIKDLHSAQLREFAVQQSEWSKQAARYTHMYNWVNATVHRSLLATAQAKLVANNNISLQELVRALKSRLAPTTSATISTVRNDYRKALERATEGRMDTRKWYDEWSRAFENGRAYGIPEVEGVMAAKDFLTALSQKLAPNWAANELATLVKNEQLGRPTDTLEEYGRVFSGLAQELAGIKPSKAPGIFATIGNRSDANQPETSSPLGNARG